MNAMSTETYVGVLVSQRHGEYEYRVAEILAADGGVQLMCLDCAADLPEERVMKQARRLYQNAKLFTDRDAAKAHACSLATAPHAIRWVHVTATF
jgi:hypothetical protein